MLQCLEQSSCYPPCPGRQRPAFQKDVGPSKKKLKWRPEFWYLVLKVQITDRPVFPSAIVQVLPVLPRTPDNRNAGAMLLMPPRAKYFFSFPFSWKTFGCRQPINEYSLLYWNMRGWMLGSLSQVFFHLVSFSQKSFTLFFLFNCSCFHKSYHCVSSTVCSSLLGWGEWHFDSLRRSVR